MDQIEEAIFNQKFYKNYDYGTLEFPGLLTLDEIGIEKKAKFIRINNDAEAKDVKTCLMKNSKLKASGPILSVTGGAQNFSINERTKTALKQALIKVAKATDALIVSGGSDCGVMKLVGDAVLEDLHEGNVLGIATFSKMLGHMKLKGKDITYKVDPNEKPAESPGVSMNPNHSHFVLFGDEQSDWGAEIDFRTQLEKELVSESKKPVFLIVVEGGPGTLKTIKNALESNFPVILVTGTRGCADLVANVWSQMNTLKSLNDEKRKEKLFELYAEKIPFIPDRDKEEDKKKYIDYLDEIVKKEKYKKLINCCEIKGGTFSLQSIIMNAFLKARKKDDDYELTQLAMKLNQFDVFEDNIKNVKEDKNIFELLEDSIILDKPEYAAVILEFVSNKLDKFLIYERYVGLYAKAFGIENENNLFETINRKIREEFDQVFRKKIEEFFTLESTFVEHNAISNTRNVALNADANNNDNNNNTSTKIDLNPTMQRDENNSETSKMLPRSQESEKNAIVKESEKNKLQNTETAVKLFYWAVLSERSEIAKLFWKFGKFHISNALIASKIFRYKAKQDFDKQDAMEAAAKEFEEMAMGVVKTFDEKMSEEVNDVLIVRFIKHLKMDCLELAVLCDCKEFVSMSVVQRVLTNLWNGNKGDQNNLKPEVEKRLKQRQIEINSDQEYKMKHYFKSETFTLLEKFTCVPIYRFWLNLISHIIFLLFFTLFMLYGFTETIKFIKHSERNDLNATNASKLESNFTTLNSTNGIDEEPRDSFEKFKKVCKHFHIVLIIWIATLMIDEFVQLVKSQRKDKTLFTLKYWEEKCVVIAKFINCKKRSKPIFSSNYWKDKWNMIDIVGVTLFIIGYILIFIPGAFIKSRVILSFDLGIWYFRLLSYCYLSKRLGPKVEMIKQMCFDLAYFLVIVLNFVMSFGITFECLLNSDNSVTDKLLNFANNVYWPIYGEIKLLETLDNHLHNNTEEITEPFQRTFVVSSYIVLMIYVIISSVLLVNLLIAMFSSTYAKIQENADRVWKNQRYHLICDYINYPSIAPPLNLLYLIYSGVRFLIHFIESSDIAQNNDSDFLTVYEKLFAEKYVKNLNKNSDKEDTNLKLEKLRETMNKMNDRLANFNLQFDNPKIELEDTDIKKKSNNNSMFTQVLYDITK